MEVEALLAVDSGACLRPGPALCFVALPVCGPPAPAHPRGQRGGQPRRVREPPAPRAEAVLGEVHTARQRQRQPRGGAEGHSREAPAPR
eukprot:2170247-Pyramimonas_sp.AAC.1